MARVDTFGPLLHRALHETERPLTLPEAAAIAGSSVKRAYAWADKHRAELVTVSTNGTNGAAAYMTRDNPHRVEVKDRTIHRDRGSGNGTALGIGTSFTVVSMGLRNGNVELELMTSTGETTRVVVIGGGDERNDGAPDVKPRGKDPVRAR